MNCPECGSSKTKCYKTIKHKHGLAHYWRCKSCGAGWQTGL